LGDALPIPVAAVPATFGSIRIAGLMLGIRDPRLMLGGRMMLCARAGAPPRYANGNAADIESNAARRAFIRQVRGSWAMGPRAYAFVTKRRGFKA
jgi:hypothetical protein